MKPLPFIALALCITAGVGTAATACGGEADSTTSPKPDAGADAAAPTGSCGLAATCAPDQYCFHGQACPLMAECSATCPCQCGTVPLHCDVDRPCFCPDGAGGGYFGRPGQVFSGPDAGAASFPDGQVYCYGS